MKKNVLITGLPRSGKTTLLEKVISDYDNKVGFVTREVKRNGERTGFEIVTSDGENSLLASVNIKTKKMVSKYSVSVKNLNLMVSRTLKYSSEDLLYLDEIGQMELFSEKFKKLVLDYLNANNVCITTVSKVFKSRFINEVLGRRDAFVVEINSKNRDAKTIFIKGLIEKIYKAKRYVKELERFKIDKRKITMNSEHGVRTLVRGEVLSCNCDFYEKYRICSHVIAAEELI